MEPNVLITQLYVGYYNRAPDPEGLNYWIGRYNAGVSLADIADSFAASPEAISTYPYLGFPNVANAETFLEQIYQNLFGRAIDADGRAYYSNKLATGQTTPGQIIAEIQANANTNPNNTDGQILANKVTVGLDFALMAANDPDFRYEGAAVEQANTILDNVDDTQASVDAALADNDQFFSEEGPGNVGDTFTLTTDAGETVQGTAANDTFNAPAGTINTFDTIRGGAGIDTLNIVTAAAAFAVGTGASIEGIENINFINTGAAGGAPDTIDASVFVGSTQIRQGGTYALDIEGLTNQTVVFTDAVSNVEYAAGAASASVNLEGIDDASTLNVDGIDLTSLTITGSVEAAAGVDETLIVTTTNELPAAGNDGSDITTVNVSLTNAVDLDVSDLVETVTFNASGSAALDTDLSALVNLETATFGAGADEVDAAISDEANTSFNLGAGNDVFTLDGTGDTDNSLTSITLGAGNDTIAISALSNISDASEAEFEAGLITVADFNADEDVLDVSALGLTLASLDNTEIGNIRDAASLYAAIELAADYIDTGVAAEDGVVFTYGDNTYLLASADNDFTAGDGLVQLVGVTANELDAASFVA